MKKHAKKIITALLVVALLIPTVAMIFSSAASIAYPVELAFNNLFIFEEWANNENSTTVVYGGDKEVGELTKDIDNGTFTLKKTKASVPQAYTGHGESKTDSIKNTDYYSIPVEPNTAYSFSYNLSGSVLTTADAFFSPYVFMFDDNFLCKVFFEAASGKSGENSFRFVTPSDVTFIQFRFTVTADEKTADAKLSNISLNKCNIESNSANLFVFNTWANSKSGTTRGVSDTVYADGTITPNPGDKSIAMEVNAGGTLFTGFDLGTTAGYYTIPVAANTDYVLNYSLINSLGTDFQAVTPYIVTSGSSGIAYVSGCGATGYGPSSCIFTTEADTTHISVVFAADNSNTSAKWQVAVKDIELLKAEKVTDNKITPHRLVKTYGEDASYGTLPTPSYIPDGYIFAGWNTREDGLGMRITADTPLQPQSLTVYPKYELAVDSLNVVNQPIKTIYTKGEKLDPTGLVLSATITGKTDADGDGTTDPDTTFEIASGYYCTPEVLDTVGTQTITAHYGGKTATFTITVKASEPGVVILNGVSTDVAIANNEYNFNYSTSAFNRYEVTYQSDSYVSGVATFNDGKTEEFFLEPSENGIFASYVDEFLDGNTYNQLVKIKFTTLDKENGNFKLVSLNTVSVADPGDTVYYNSPNGKYEMGVSLYNGGVVSELYDLSGVYARTYSNGSNDITLVDYKSKLDSGHKAESGKVNLINTLDRGRYLQQSYYGTGDKPYVQSEYNNADWPYNPVQGGNVIGEPSKIIDYKITNDYVYVKARPLDWAKWSDEYAEGDARYDAVWGDDYITDTYVEAWYYFQGDTIKVTNRKVDYSGLPEASHSQEFPALYLIEPLNHFVYNNVSAENAWKTETSALYDNYQFIDYTDSNRANHWNATHDSGKLINYEEPEYWGLTQMYKDKFGMQNFEPWVNVNENWAAFTASEDADSFGVGIYTDVTTKFYYGVQPTMYQQTAGDTEGSVGSVLDTPEYRHAQTINPSPELPTSYIAPTDTMVFRSYEPTEFTYYLSTGTASEIRENFRVIAENEAADEAAKVKIAVPETVYLDPANNKLGQYYATNILNPNNYYSIEPKAEYTDMYLGVYAKNGHTHISVNVENIDTPSNDVDVCASGDTSASYDGIVFKFTDDTDPNEGTFIFPAGLDMDFDSTAAGLQPGETATVKWTITTYAADPAINPNCEKEVFTAYTVMYAPGRTVGAVAEARQINASQNEIASWITGANGVDHSQRAPLGSYHGDYHDSGYFRDDPLVNPDEAMKGFPVGGTGESEEDYIIVDGINGEGTSIDYSDTSYVMQTATNGHDSSRSQSYLGLLTVDKSRYVNTDQIPNLRIGFDALRVGSDYPKNSLESYKTYYTLGDSNAYTATSLSEAPSGWTTYSNYDQLVEVIGEDKIPYRESLVPSFRVSEIDGKYIHALNQGKCIQSGVAARYSTAGTSVLCSVTDKSELRDAVTDGYGVIDPTDEFLDKLEEAATILGDPSSTQEEIDNATDSLYDYVNKFYALKYDNLFSSYEFSQNSNSMTMSQPANSSVSYNAGTITITNSDLGVNAKGEDIEETYTSYGSGAGNYLIDLKPNTEYVFEYDVTTDVKAQAFMFFYNSSGGAGDVPTNMSIKVNGGNWSPKSESNAWWGNYTDTAGTYHYAIKFTTGANTAKASFRFGNKSNDPVTSTFSNIKLIDSERYYEDVEYTKTEDVYKEYTLYGALQVPVRNGYTFGGWKDGDGNSITAVDTATKHLSIFSEWDIKTYTITYDANGGSVTPATQNYTINDTITIPTPTRDKYIFQGWTVTVAEGNWEPYGICLPGEVSAKMYGNVTLTAQWTLNNINVTFDNLINITEWQESNKNNSNVTDITETGFSVKNEANGHEKTSTSPFFTVEPGKQYRVDIDITGENWDVYFFFCNENGAWVDFSDSQNRYSYGGGGNTSQIFTAPNKSEVVKAQIRVDCNEISTEHTVNFNNIRVYEYDEISLINVSPVNKTVSAGDTFGDLPTPTKEGFTFVGWFDENGTQVTSASTVPNEEDGHIPLTSKWKLADTALNADLTVIDFGSSVAIDADENDTIFTKTAAFYGTTGSVVSISTDGNSYASTADGSYGNFKIENGNIVYTPTTIVNDVDTVYYRAQLSSGDTTVVNSKVTVVPASNVLYEENVFDVTNKNGVEWKTEGTAANAAQTNDNIYGFDASYNNNSTYSNGSALKVTVDENNKRSQILSFTFTGTGFNLYGACGSTTGVQLVTIKNNTTGKMVKSIVVDTYYNDTFGTLNQVPIVSETLPYAEYTVQVMASYLPTMSGALNAQSVENIDGMTVNVADADDNAALREALAEIGMEYILDAEAVDVVWFDEDSVLNGGMGAATQKDDTVATAAAVTELLNVIDSIRVYSPAVDADEYYLESEQFPTYYNVIDNLVNGNGGITDGNDEGLFAYVAGKISEQITFENYSSIGPKDELYLSGSSDKGVTFTVNNFDKYTTKVMISVRSVYSTDTDKPMLKVGEGSMKITSNTEMYYDITNYVADDGTVTIQNTTAGTLLSVGYVKIVGETVEVASTFNLETARLMMAAPAEEVDFNAPVVEPDVSTPEEDTTPEEDAGTDDGTTEDDTKECWLISILKKIFSFFAKTFDFIKNVFSKVFSY